MRTASSPATKNPTLSMRPRPHDGSPGPLRSTRAARWRRAAFVPFAGAALALAACAEASSTHDPVCDRDVSIATDTDARAIAMCTRIGGSLVVKDTALVELPALTNLRRVDGDLVVAGNPRLRSLGGLGSLRGVGHDVVVSRNVMLPRDEADEMLARLDEGEGVGGTTAVFCEDDDDMDVPDDLDDACEALGALGLDDDMCDDDAAPDDDAVDPTDDAADDDDAMTPDDNDAANPADDDDAATDDADDDAATPDDDATNDDDAPCPDADGDAGDLLAALEAAAQAVVDAAGQCAAASQAAADCASAGDDAGLSAAVDEALAQADLADGALDDLLGMALQALLGGVDLDALIGPLSNAVAAACDAADAAEALLDAGDCPAAVDDANDAASDAQEAADDAADAAEEFPF